MNIGADNLQIPQPQIAQRVRGALSSYWWYDTSWVPALWSLGSLVPTGWARVHIGPGTGAAGPVVGLQLLRERAKLLDINYSMLVCPEQPLMR